MPISKEEILQEIRNLAEANGEVPGQKQFELATRIKVGHWKGRHWARWGDALIEAGFEPNTLNPKIPEEHALAQLAVFVKELGRFPVQPEVNMRARSTPGFPSWDTFVARFGSMTGTATALREYSDTNGDREVAGICQARIDQEAAKPLRSVESKRTEKTATGFVYLKYSPSLRLYKIGKATDTDKRGAGISLLLPEDLVPRHEIKTDQPYILEKYWHSRFSHKKKQGEWFDLTTADIEAFKKRREFMFSEFFP